MVIQIVKILQFVSGVLGMLCAYLTMSFFGLASLFFPEWVDDKMQSLYRWIDED